MQQEDQRNFIIAMVVMVVFILAYQTLVTGPEAARREAALEAARLEAESAAPAPDVPVVEISASVEDALGTSDRVVFDGAAVDGSIRLRGARLDDLKMKRHFVDTDRTEELRLLRPERAGGGYYAAWYWRDASGLVNGLDAEWEQVGGSTLTSTQPIQLRYETSAYTIEREVSLDENYMFTFTDRVTNISDEARAVYPYGVVRRNGNYREFGALMGEEDERNVGLVHLGLIGVLNGKLALRKYKPLQEGKEAIRVNPVAKDGGWIGFTDKYWMGALVPDQAREFTADFRRGSVGEEQIMEVRTTGAGENLQPGQSITVSNRMFAGAKELAVLQAYGDDLELDRFDDAVDWGFLYFLTKPFFNALVWLNGVFGSFGLAIMAFVVAVKLVLFPLYNRSYVSMAKMRKLAEPMKELQERFASDPQRRQQEILKLYQKEKANPIAGCLPILATIPIFFALYKTLIVTLEMRHEPFLYMKDLSQPDPTAIGNLYGLLPWSAELVKDIPILGLVIGLGVLPLAYGASMFILQSLSPPPPDPTQRRIMMFLPLIFMFVMSGFGAGLLVYWVWNNVLSTAQQYYIMRRNGVYTEFDKWLARRLGRPEPGT